MGVFLTSSFLNVGLSPTPCLERVRRLERQGFIQGYTALLNPIIWMHHFWYSLRLL